MRWHEWATYSHSLKSKTNCYSYTLFILGLHIINVRTALRTEGNSKAFKRSRHCKIKVLYDERANNDQAHSTRDWLGSEAWLRCLSLPAQWAAGLHFFEEGTTTARQQRRFDTRHLIGRVGEGALVWRSLGNHPISWLLLFFALGSTMASVAGGGDTEEHRPISIFSVLVTQGKLSRRNKQRPARIQEGRNSVKP